MTSRRPTTKDHHAEPIHNPLHLLWVHRIYERAQLLISTHCNLLWWWHIQSKLQYTRAANECVCVCQLVDTVQALCSDTQCQVRLVDGTSEAFEVRQGCVLQLVLSNVSWTVSWGKAWVFCNIFYYQPYNWWRLPASKECKKLAAWIIMLHRATHTLVTCVRGASRSLVQHRKATHC